MKSSSATACCELTLLLVVALALFIPANAAVPPEDLRPPKEGYTQLLDLEDGSTLNGKILEVNGNEVTIESSVGTVTILSSKIRQIREVPIKDIRGGAYWFPNPNRTRLYLGPTARMTPRGTGSFSDVYLFFPSATYGLTNNVTLSGGMSLFPGLGVDEQLFYFIPKVGVGAAKNLSVAASALITILPEWADAGEEIDTDGDGWPDETIEETVTVGIIFGVATYGTDDKSVTFGLGFGYADEDIDDKPAVLFGGEYRVARRLSLVSENWVMPGVEPVMVSYGVRFFGEGLAVDLAFVNVASEDAIFPGVPYIGFVWNY